MNIYFDMEFTGLHQRTTPISIGIVTDSGRTFYAEFTDYDRTQVDAWIDENVIAHLWHSRTAHPWRVDGSEHLSYCGTRGEVGAALASWLAQFDSVTVWSDCLAYDWVLFCELFGGALELPKHVYYIPFDLSTAFRLKGVDPDISREAYAGIEGDKHHALHDAQVIKACIQRLFD